DVVDVDEALVEVADVDEKVLVSRREVGERREEMPGTEDLVPAPRVPVPADQITPVLSSVALADAEVGEAEQHLGPGLHEGPLQLQLSGHPFVVRVEEGHQGPARLLEAAIA